MALGYVEGAANRVFQICRIQSMKERRIRDDSEIWPELRIQMTPLPGRLPGSPQLPGPCLHGACHGLSLAGLGASQGSVGLVYYPASEMFDK